MRASSFASGALIHGMYRVERVLAEGPMGGVLLASHLERCVAVKVLRKERRTPEIDARFAREAHLATRLGGEHVAHVLDSGYAESGDAFLVSEHLAGHDLRAELGARSVLPPREAVDVVLEACAGVAEAHAAGLVHGALKPANVFLARRPAEEVSRAVVLDFGLTRVSNEKGQIDLTDTEIAFGTHQYRAPEQIRSGRVVDARADQHALGAILHELLSGAPAFRAPSEAQLAVAIATAPPPRVRDSCPGAPPALDEAIRRSLGKRPEDRFPDLIGFAEAIAPSGGSRARAALAAVREVLSPVSGTRARPRILGAVASMFSAVFKTSAS